MEIVKCLIKYVFSFMTSETSLCFAWFANLKITRNHLKYFCLIKNKNPDVNPVFSVVHDVRYDPVSFCFLDALPMTQVLAVPRALSFSWS